MSKTHSLVLFITVVVFAIPSLADDYPQLPPQYEHNHPQVEKPPPEHMQPAPPPKAALQVWKPAEAPKHITGSEHKHRSSSPPHKPPRKMMPALSLYNKKSRSPTARKQPTSVAEILSPKRNIKISINIFNERTQFKYSNVTSIFHFGNFTMKLV